MSNIFNSVKGLHPRRNSFSADTYRNDFTAPLGVNIPCYLQEVPPGTFMRLSTHALIRLQALIAPVMDNIDFYVHYWKLSNRIIENDLFTQFISGEIEPEDYEALFSTPYGLASEVLPLLDGSDNIEGDYELIFGNGSILDFLGYDRGLFPDLVEEEGVYSLTGGNDTTLVNWRSLIAYYMVHVEWYMNENVPYFTNFVSIVEKLVKEQDLPSLAELLAYTIYMYGDDRMCSFLPHGWDKDYFTSALPNVQYGDPVSLPIAGSAPVKVPAQTVILNPVTDPTTLQYIQFKLDGIPQSPNGNIEFSQVAGAYGKLGIDTGQYNFINQMLGKLEGNNQDKSLDATADLSEATAITINELRFANALQVFKERRMRFGRRRLEYYKGFFDVTPEDLRLQVPKYLGGGRIPINIADIEQTSQTSGSQALGHLAGKATAVAGGFAGFSTYCSEESIIIGIAFAIPHITYAQQLSRFKLKTNDIYDYFNPSFEHLGEQAIKKIEIYAGSGDPDGDFGYTPRYTEYRFHSNEMHGAFKDSLAYWSLGRIFSKQPALNAKFVYMQPAVFNRIFAVANQPSMIVSMLFKVEAVKPVSKFGTPMLLA